MPQTGRLQKERKPLVRYGFKDMMTYASNIGHDDIVADALMNEPSMYSESVEREEKGHRTTTIYMKKWNLLMMKIRPSDARGFTRRRKELLVQVDQSFRFLIINAIWRNHCTS